MPVDHTRLALGQCYITTAGQVRRILEITPDGNVRFDSRNENMPNGSWEMEAVVGIDVFAQQADREVPRDQPPGSIRKPSR
jgi:hypothetical protein